jgi:hypothetical protein
MFLGLGRIVGLGAMAGFGPLGPNLFLSSPT